MFSFNFEFQSGLYILLLQRITEELGALEMPNWLVLPTLYFVSIQVVAKYIFWSVYFPAKILTKLTEPKAEVPHRLDLVEQVSITTTFGDSFLSSFSI